MVQIHEADMYLAHGIFSAWKLCYLTEWDVNQHTIATEITQLRITEKFLQEEIIWLCQKATGYKAINLVHVFFLDGIASSYNRRSASFRRKTFFISAHNYTQEMRFVNTRFKTNKQTRNYMLISERTTAFWPSHLTLLLQNTLFQTKEKENSLKSSTRTLKPVEAFQRFQVQQVCVEVFRFRRLQTTKEMGLQLFDANTICLWPDPLQQEQFHENILNLNCFMNVLISGLPVQGDTKSVRRVILWLYTVLSV